MNDKDKEDKQLNTPGAAKRTARPFDVIIKRDGREVVFDQQRIADAIHKAMSATTGGSTLKAMRLAEGVMRALEKDFSGVPYTVEEIQNQVEKALIRAGLAETSKAYILYRAQRTRVREAEDELNKLVGEIEAETSRENANVGTSPAAKMLQIGAAASRRYYLSKVIPPEMADAHLHGDLHIHDLDFYGKTLNCLEIPLGDLLRKGFNPGHGYVRPPKRPMSAVALASIIVQSSQNDMFGGQGYAFFDRDMAPYVDGISDREMYQAMEALVYNANTMHSRAGSQTPFFSVNLGAETDRRARRVTRNLLLAYEAGLGRGENPIFPNIIFRVKRGVNLDPGDPNYDLFQLALKVAARRLNPTFSFMDAPFNAEYGTQVAYMGCRTRVMANRRGPVVTDGRGNLSATTLNLPRLAIKARGNWAAFGSELERVVDLAIRQLLHRYQVQARLKVRDMPFVMGQHLYLGSEGLGPDDSIEPAMANGTLAVGFIGLAEALVGMQGAHHGQSSDAQALGLKVVSAMRTQIDRACKRHDLNFTLLATPAEGLSGRFVGLDRKKYGVVPGITDRGFYTNSFHIPVEYPISVVDKIALEGPYHKYCNAGHISYVELASPPQHNVEAMEAIIRHMAASGCGYGGINYPVDNCRTCGYSGVINDETCPNCGATGTITRVRRITGYLGTTDMIGGAKLAEISARVAHNF